MIEFPMSKTMMGLALIVVILLIVRALLKRHNLEISKIDLDDLLLGDDGRLSKAAAVMMGSFAITSWLMVYLALNDKMTEGYLAAYIAAWIAPTVTKLVTNRPNPAVSITETSTVSTSKTATPTGG